jgi:hypothetical protein
VLGREEGGGAAVVAELVRDGLLERRGDRFRTTRRWQSAMARAAFRLISEGNRGEDLRLPMIVALVELYGEACSPERLVACVETMLPIELYELRPEDERAAAGG